MKDLEGHGAPRAEPKAHAEAADRFLFPQLVTQTDLRLAVADLKLAVADLKAEISSAKVWLISTVIGVAGLALVIAKLT
jgi:hypothetical protein